MKQIRDTFLHFIADNAPTRVVHPLRADASDPTASRIAIDAINVTFIEYAPLQGNSKTKVVLDVVYESESSVMAAIEELTTLLTSAYYTPLMSYASGTPVVVGGNVHWDRDGVRFFRVGATEYCHYSCVLVLRSK